LSADHQNKPDAASTIARGWYERDNVNAVLDLTTSAVALAVREVALSKNRAMLIASASSPEMTGKDCSPNTVHWGFDSYSNSITAAKLSVAAGMNAWFFITGDNAGSRAQEEQAAIAVKRAGGQVIGSVRHPLGTSDFSSFLLQAQASGAKVMALANAGADTTPRSSNRASLDCRVKAEAYCQCWPILPIFMRYRCPNPPNYPAQFV
jgi:branched-chain amino acid transport system substrate-binding protein